MKFFLLMNASPTANLRKYHSDKLMQANAPLIHQQALLAQNVRAYLEKTKQKRNKIE